MKYISLFFVVLISLLSAHNPAKENLRWKQYYRLGTVYSNSSSLGFSGYSRIKRTTKTRFMDLRFFGHFFENDSEIRIRQKSSRQFLSFENTYVFNTLIYEKNTMLNIDLRYHYNQGLGLLLKKSEKGNITTEFGVAFDNSDYLNTEQKTTYLRVGGSIDHSINPISIKFEIDYFYQLSELVSSSSLSRLQVLNEIEWEFTRKFGVIAGMTWDIQEGESEPSLFLTFSFNNPLSWKF